MNPRRLLRTACLILAALWLAVVGAGAAQAQARTVRVGVYQNEPKVFVDEGGQPAGIFVDLLDEIAAQEGWTVVYEPCVFADCLTALEAGDLDLMPDVAVSAEREVRFDFHATPVLESWSRIYAAPSVSINALADLAGKRVAVLQGSIQQTVFEQLMRGFGYDVTLVPTASLDEAFALAAEGSADAAIANHFFGDYFYQDLGLTKTTIDFNPAQLYFATGQGRNADLLAAIDRYLNQWIANAGSPYYSTLGHWSDQAPTFRIPTRYALWILGGAAGLLLLTVGTTVLFRRQVAVRTRHLEQARAELQASEERYQNLARISPVGIFRTDAHGATTYVNPRWSEISGLPPEAALGDGWLAAVHPDDRPHLRQGWQTSTQRRAPSFTEYRFLRPDGTTAWVMGQALPEMNAAQEIVGYVGTITDITERKEAETILREQERFISAIVNTTPAMVYVVDMATLSNVYANTGLERLLGYTAEELQALGGDLFAHLIHPDDLPAVSAAQTQMLALSDADTLELTYRVRHRDGTWRTLHSYERPFLRRPDGSLEQKIGVAVDITERTQAEAMIKRERDFSEALLDSMPNVFYLYDQNMKFLRWNRNFEQVTGYTSEEMARLKPLDFFAGDEKALVAERIGAVFTRGYADVEANFLAKDGTQTPYYFTGLRTVLDGQVCLIGVGIDVTERKRAEDELRRLNAELEQRVAARTEELNAALHKAQAADRLKSAFLATMSHELRTPLNSIIGFTGVLLQGLAGPLNPEQSKQLGMTRDSARHLLALINDVLDISKIEAGQLEVVHAPFELRAAIEQCLRVVTPQAQKKGLALTAAIGASVGLVVSDRRRVEQILLNLLSNAIKFTEHGEVRVACRARGDMLEISVSDTGIGIRPEDLDKLFEPFRQLETGLNRRHEGTGLGLAICRNLVHLLGGQIRVDSTLGAGSTFTFTLPRPPAE